MADYSKRDARKERLTQLATHSDERLDGPPVPACHCGQIAVVAFTPIKGESRFFCEAHSTEAEKLFGG